MNGIIPLKCSLILYAFKPLHIILIIPYLFKLMLLRRCPQITFYNFTILVITFSHAPSDFQLEDKVGVQSL